MGQSRISFAGSAAALALALGGAACGRPSEPSEPELPSWLSAAVVAPETTVEFNGTAEFGVGTHWNPAVGRVFQLSSWEKPHGDFISFHRTGEGRPPVGEYELGLFRRQGDVLLGFGALYSRKTEDGTIQENYTSTSGSVRITHSSSDRVDGEFHFTAELYCTYELLAKYPGGADCDPSRPRGDAPPLLVTGSFSAGNADKGTIMTDDLPAGAS